MKRAYAVYVVIFVLALSSCAGLNTKQQAGLMANIEQGNFSNASVVFDNKIDLQEKNKDIPVLLGLQAGTCYLVAGNYTKAVTVLDVTERAIKKQDEAWLAENIQKGVLSTIVNDSITEYERKEYDAVMLNTYKALGFMLEGDMENTRVELNRALDRQRRAKEYFRARIEKKRKEMKKRAKERRKKLAKKEEDEDKGIEIPTVNTIMQKEEVNSTLQKRYSNLDQFAVYPDFVNPFTTYLSGLFFMLQADYAKANTYLKETYGMIENKEVVEKDFLAVENILNKGAKPPQEQVWVIFANGLAPEKKEWRIDLPLFVVNKKVLHAGIALPKLEPRQSAQPFLQIQPSVDKLLRTGELTSMDGVVAQEFKKEYPYIMTRAITSALFKTVAQYYAGEKFGIFGSMAGAVYSVAATGTDTRMWQGLPKNFQVARFDRPQDGTVHINTPQGARLTTVRVPEDKNSVVFVKQTTPRARVFADVTSF